MFHDPQTTGFVKYLYIWKKIDKDDTYDNHLSVILLHLQSTNTNRVILLEILE
jgi:hypothetical protein